MSYLILLGLARHEFLVDGCAGADAPRERFRLGFHPRREGAAERLSRLLGDEVGRGEVRLGGNPQIVARACLN
jgi:hypothetical protein